MSLVLGLRGLTRCSAQRPTLRNASLAISSSRRTPHTDRRTIFGVGEGMSMAALTASKYLMYGTIGTNIAVFGAWWYSSGGPRQGRGMMDILGFNKRQATPEQRVRKVLEENFVLHTNDTRNGRWWTLLTSAFSHKDTYHILGNMFTLNAFMSVLIYYGGVPPQAMAALMLGSALSGSVGFLMHERGYFGGGNKTGVYQQRAALGASGMVMGLGAVAALLAPNVKLALMGIVPVPMW